LTVKPFYNKIILLSILFYYAHGNQFCGEADLKFSSSLFKGLRVWAAPKFFYASRVFLEVWNIFTIEKCSKKWKFTKIDFCVLRRTPNNLYLYNNTDKIK